MNGLSLAFIGMIVFTKTAVENSRRQRSRSLNSQMSGPIIMWLSVHGDLVRLIEISLLLVDMMLHIDQLDD